jgi:glutathione synthase/RimK-type ligase-like ATP-grasp enzyme
VIDLCAVTAVYLRTYDWRRFPDLQRAGPDSPAWRHASGVEALVQIWLELTPALVVNPMMAMATNSSKPYQALRIQSHGFAVPDTLITTDPDAAREFWEQHGTVIYKSISGIRSIVSRLTPEHLDRLQDVAWCPTQFQQYIPGHDYRVHVVGEEIFACEIITQGDDYRYAGRQGATVDVHAYSLPSDCAHRCRALALDLGLPVAGIDLRRTPEGQWYCFEVNPSPAFTFYQEATGQPIDEAIAQFLRSGAATVLQ